MTGKSNVIVEQNYCFLSKWLLVQPPVFQVRRYGQAWGEEKFILPPFPPPKKKNKLVALND